MQPGDVIVQINRTPVGVAPRTRRARSITMRGAARSASSASASGQIVPNGLLDSMSSARPLLLSARRAVCIPGHAGAVVAADAPRALAPTLAGPRRGRAAARRADPRRGDRADARRTSTTSTSTSVAAYERRFRHDVMAHVHAFGDAAPAAHKYIHLGATSAFVTDNADLIIMRRGLRAAPRPRHRACCVRSRPFAREWRAEPTLGYTHLQPAQPTTVGKRATLWMQDLVLDLADSIIASRRCPSAA